MVDMKTLAERFGAEREARGDTQEQLARIAGVSKQAISKIEAGGTIEPASSTLEPIAAHWRLSTRWLMKGTGPRERGETDPDWADVQGYAQAVGLGAGVEADEYAEAHKLKFKASSLSRKRLQAEKLAVFYGKGDSMLPRVHSGDAVLFDTGDTKVRDGALYVIQVLGVSTEYQVKRAMILDDAVFFSADNPSGDHKWIKPRRMDAKREPIQVVGRVRWIGSWED